MMDLSHTTGGMFTTFYANTPAGENAWKEIAGRLTGRPMESEI